MMVKREDEKREMDRPDDRLTTLRSTNIEYCKFVDDNQI